MFLTHFALFNLFATAPVYYANAQIVAYRVNIQPLPSTLNLPAAGFATIFTDAATSLTGYAGIVTKLEPNLLASTCNATNGCGVHIHSGKSCNSTATQGGHYYNNVTVPIDPWIDERYSSDTTGKANFQAIVQMGTIDVEGRVFIGKFPTLYSYGCVNKIPNSHPYFASLVHSKNGTRIGCGTIEKVPSGQGKLLTSNTANLTKSGVTSSVVVQTIEPDIACYYGSAKKLEPNLVSFLNKNKTLLGKNCNFTNGCGVHIHNGTSCFNTSTQGGHYYDKVKYPIDPWLLTMYHSTDNVGNAFYTGCAETGVPSFVDRPFVVHSDNGTRVSCGLLQVDGAPIAAPIKSPTSATTKNPTNAPTGRPAGAKTCGLFGLSIFCPLTGCGIIGRFLGFCQR